MSVRAAFQNINPRWSLIAAVALALLTAALRLWQINESLWIDELHTAWCAVGTLGEAAPRAAMGNQAPLFFWLEWVLVRVLGPSELSLRLPSILAGSLLPLAAYLFARRWTTSGVGILAAALLAIDPAAIFYATEARPYALVQLLALLHVAVTAEMVIRPEIWLRAAWIAIAALLFHLHYTAALLIPAELTFYGLFALLRPQDVRYPWTWLLVDIAIVALLWLPAIGNIQAIFARRANWAEFVKIQPPWVIFDVWPVALGMWYVAAVIAIDGIFLGRTVADTRINNRRMVLAILVLSWLVVPVVVAWLLTENDVARLFFPRYVISCSVAAILLAALSVELAPWRWAKVAVGILILAAVFWSSGIGPRLQQGGRAIEPRGEDWRACVGWLNSELPRTQYPVLVASGLIEADALRQPHDVLLEDYCLLPVTSLYPLDVDRGDMFPLPMHEPGRLAQVAEMLVVHRGGAWLIVRGDPRAGERVANRIVAELNKPSPTETNAKWKIQEARSFGRVQVLLLATQALR